MVHIGGIDVYGLLTSELPKHWPKPSVYRLKSVQVRILKKCKNQIVPLEQLPDFILKVTKESLIDKHGKPIKYQTLKTYRSTLFRYISERLVGESLKPWEATRFFNALKNKK